MPLIQVRCDCGADFSGREEKFKVCPACACVLENSRIRCDCGYLFIFRRFLDKQAVQEITQQDLYVARKMGETDGMVQEMVRSKQKLDQAKQDRDAAYRAGVAHEKARNAAEWEEFFALAGFTNPYTKTPIRSREDYYEYRKRFDAERAAASGKREKYCIADV